jgi:hypothetical protein
MKLKLLSRPVGFIASLVVILACSLIRPQGPQASATLSAVPTAVQAGVPVLASPIRLVIPSGLGTGASAETIDVATDQTGSPWDIAPAHLQLTLQGYTAETSYHVPQFFVYPAKEYAAANQTAAESIKHLQVVLSNPNAQYTNDVLPDIPFFNAGQVFAAQEKVIQFKGGSGLRTVTQYAQDVSPINNSGLFYHFEGLTSDEKFYLVAILPTNLPFLPADNNPASVVPAGGVTFPPNDASGSSFENYYQQVTGLINGSSADQFNPSLNALDALIQSISTQ